VATDDLWTSMRLGERKVLVVQGLMDEAEVESSRCEGETERCNQELQIDDECVAASRHLGTAAMFSAQTRTRPPRDTLDRVERAKSHSDHERPQIEAQLEP